MEDIINIKIKGQVCSKAKERNFETQKIVVMQATLW